MPRFRETLTVNAIYSDRERAFLTSDGEGGFWGEGDDPVADLREQYGEDTPVILVDGERMESIAIDAYTDEDEEDGA